MMEMSSLDSSSAGNEQVRDEAEMLQKRFRCNGEENNSYIPKGNVGTLISAGM
jgi:hypothetical protein